MTMINPFVVLISAEFIVKNTGNYQSGLLLSGLLVGFLLFC